MVNPDLVHDVCHHQYEERLQQAADARLARHVRTRKKSIVAPLRWWLGDHLIVMGTRLRRAKSRRPGPRTEA